MASDSSPRPLRIAAAASSDRLAPATASPTAISQVREASRHRAESRPAHRTDAHQCLRLAGCRAGELLNEVFGIPRPAALREPVVAEVACRPPPDLSGVGRLAGVGATPHLGRLLCAAISSSSLSRASIRCRRRGERDRHIRNCGEGVGESGHGLSSSVSNVHTIWSTKLGTRIPANIWWRTGYLTEAVLHRNPARNRTHVQPPIS